jgi:hypothetical protein
MRAGATRIRSMDRPHGRSRCQSLIVALKEMRKIPATKYPLVPYPITGP